MNESTEAFKQGIFSLEKKSYADASAYFEKAVDLNPQNLDHHYYLAFSYARQGKFPVAMRMIRRALTLSKENLKTYNLQEPYAAFFVLIGAIHEEQGVFPKAVRAYEKAMKLGTPKKDILQKRIDHMKGKY
ncbi:tetratricopeptide repeat protein [Candidatus Woesearchaeota archaeon]|nr:tetratricopeptide repeat protein [Candidatus Woesearchaeota archaeon]